MKKTLIVILAVVFIGMMAAPSFAGGPADTGKQWIQKAVDKGLGPQAVPEAGYMYYVDLMSNAIDQLGNQWGSFLVVINWDQNVRIHVFTGFIPAGGTPNDYTVRDFYINAQDVAVLTPFDLGFLDFGNTNWYGMVWNDVNVFFSCGVLLYHTEYGLTWMTPWGPYSI